VGRIRTASGVVVPNNADDPLMVLKARRMQRHPAAGELIAGFGSASRTPVGSSGFPREDRVAATGKEREQRAAQERARRYAARQELYRQQQGRRRRDNLIALIAGGVLILAVIAGQTAFFTVGPGAPEPSPTSTPAATDTPTTAPTGTVPPTPESTPSVDGSEAPAE
jgi:hypothetical protein